MSCELCELGVGETNPPGARLGVCWCFPLRANVIETENPNIGLSDNAISTLLSEAQKSAPDNRVEIR